MELRQRVSEGSAGGLRVGLRKKINGDAVRVFFAFKKDSQVHLIDT